MYLTTHHSANPSGPYIALIGLVCLLTGLPVGASNVHFDSFSVEDGLSQANVTTMVQDSIGHMWLGTMEGLNRYDGYSFEVFEHDPDDPGSIADDSIWALLVDSKGRLWVGTNSGFSLFDYPSRTFRNFRHDPANENTIRSDLVRFLHEDSEGYIWIATRGGGLSRFAPETDTYVHYRFNPGDPLSLPSDLVNTIFEWNRTLFVGTDAGTAVIDSARSSVTLHPASKNLAVRVITEFNGKLWMGTHSEGLLVFDPLTRRTQHYANDPDNNASLPGNLIRDLLVDHRGKLWVATDSGLAELIADDGEFVVFRNDPADPYSIADTRIDSLFEDRGNVLWVGTYGGFSRWNYVSDSFSHYFAGSGHLANDVVNAIVEGEDGEIWVGSYGGGVDRLVPDERAGFVAGKKPGLRLQDDRVMALAFDDEGVLWVGTRTAGLYRYDPTTSEQAHFLAGETGLSNDGVTAITTHGDSIWIGTYGGGLNHLDRSTGKFTHYRHDPENPASLGSDKVLAIYRDARGNFWIGTEEGGLNRFNPVDGSFQRYVHDPDDPASLSSNTAWEILEAANGDLWIATWGGGINRWTLNDRAADVVQFKRIDKGDGLIGDTVFGILEAATGHLWLSGNRGLTEYGPADGVMRHFDKRNGIRGDEFNFGARLKTSTGQLVFGSNVGVVVFDPESVQVNRRVPPIYVTASSTLQGGIFNASGLDRVQSLEVGYGDRYVDFRFAALDFASPDKNTYRYMLDGFDEDWIDPENFRRATYTNLPSGNYVFRVRAANNDGIWNDTAVAIPLEVVPPFWLSVYAYTLYVLIIAGIVATYVLVQRNKLSNEAKMRRLLEVEVRQRTLELAERNEQLEDANEKLTVASMSDALTGLQNRRYLYSYLESQIAALNRLVARLQDLPDAAVRIRREGSLFFMMIDLDGFKAINDTFGHAAGDAALLQVRDLLRASTRESDVIIRWGGDEFLIVGKSESQAGLELLAERIRHDLTEHDYVVGEGQVGSLAGSIGVALFPFNAHHPRRFTWEQVVAVADQAAYVAKANGGNAWVTLGAVETTEQIDVIRMKEDLSAVIDAGQVQATSSMGDNLRVDASRDQAGNDNRGNISRIQ
ncbi:MAG: two-component regulator propeller domain-containing protein [Pseudomonadota bacterium]